MSRDLTRAASCPPTGPELQSRMTAARTAWGTEVHLAKRKLPCTSFRPSRLLYRSYIHILTLVTSFGLSGSSIHLLTLSLPSSKVHSPSLPKRKCILSEVARIGSIIVYHLSKLWEAMFFILCDVSNISGEAAGELWNWSNFSLLRESRKTGLPGSSDGKSKETSFGGNLKHTGDSYTAVNRCVLWRSSFFTSNRRYCPWHCLGITAKFL